MPDALKALQQGRAGTTPLEHLASCQKLLALAQVAGITQPHVLRWPLLMQSQLELARAYGRVGCLPQAVQHASDSLESAEEALTEGCLDRAEEAQVCLHPCGSVLSCHVPALSVTMSHNQPVLVFLQRRACIACVRLTRSVPFR